MILNVLNTLPHSMHMYILTWHMAIKILTDWVLDFFWNLKGHYTCPMFLLRSGGRQTLILFLLTDWLVVLYSTILCFQTDSLCSSHTPLWMTDCSFTQCILNIHQSAVLTDCLLVIWLVPHQAAAILAYILHTPYTNAPVYSLFLNMRALK